MSGAPGDGSEADVAGSSCTFALADPAHRDKICASPMRVVGKRKEGAGDRDGLDSLALKFGGGAKKGVFRFRSQEEANRDQDQWMIERVQRRIRTCSE